MVIEEREFKSPSLKWLQEEVKTDRFVLRTSIPMRTNDKRFDDTTLNIYEFKEMSDPLPGQVLDMNIPLMGDSISVKLDDLIRLK